MPPVKINSSLTRSLLDLAAQLTPEFAQQQCAPGQKDTPIMDISIQRSLNDKLYDKRKVGALE